MKKSTLLLILLLLSLAGYCERVKVLLFSKTEAASYSFTFKESSFVVDLGRDGGMVTFSADDVIKLAAVSGKVSFDDQKGTALLLDSLVITPNDEIHSYTILTPTLDKSRDYQGSFIIKNNGSEKLRIINDVDQEIYIAGVTSCEIPCVNDNVVITQAAAARTWYKLNRNKHKKEGFNVCDDVHCQAYLHKCPKDWILNAVFTTAGMDIVDENGRLIETVFYANSGGFTANSEDVWKNPIPYLRSVEDPYSIETGSYHWKRKIHKKEDLWLNYFSSKAKVDISDDEIRFHLLHYHPERRESTLYGIKLETIRSQFGLTSAFFVVEWDSINHEVIFDGYGFGHGVGLSQDGTVAMGKQGKAPEEIVGFYYTGATLRHNPEEEAKYANLQTGETGETASSTSTSSNFSSSNTSSSTSNSYTSSNNNSNSTSSSSSYTSNTSNTSTQQTSARSHSATSANAVSTSFSNQQSSSNSESTRRSHSNSNNNNSVIFTPRKSEPKPAATQDDDDPFGW